MSESIEFSRFANKVEKRAEAVKFAKILNNVFFFYFVGETWVPEIEDFDGLDELNDVMWLASCASMGAMGIDVIGKTQDNKIVITIEPSQSIRDFLIAKDVGQEDDIYYEDVFEEIGEDSGFGKHDNAIVGE